MSMPKARSIKEIAAAGSAAGQEIRFGFEGITMVGDTLWMAVQREWKDDPEGHGQAAGLQHRRGNLGRRALPAGRARPKAPGWACRKSPLHGDWVYIVERDNQIADKAATKKLYRVPLAEMVPAELGGPLPVVTKELVRDLLPDLAALNGYVVDKIEGFAIDAAGNRLGRDRQ